MVTRNVLNKIQIQRIKRKEKIVLYSKAAIGGVPIKLIFENILWFIHFPSKENNSSEHLIYTSYF